MFKETITQPLSPMIMELPGEEDEDRKDKGSSGSSTDSKREGEIMQAED